MSVVGFLLLTLGCVTLCSHIHYEYHLIKEGKTWQAAKSYCREKYTDLATVPSLGDMKRLIEMSEANYDVTEGIWIGLTHATKHSWLWVDEGNMMNHESHEFTGSMRAPLSEHYCAFVDGYERFSPTNCENDLPYVCQEYQSSKMYFYEKNVTWKEALNSCRLKGMELASARSETDKKALRKILDYEKLQTLLWIGLFRDKWKWSDGSNSSFRYWSPTDQVGPGDCVTFEPSSKGWKHRSCAATYPFYCYNGLSKKKTQIVRLEMKANSLVNFSDDAVTEAILNQLQNKHSGVKLQWKVQPDGKIFKKKDKDDD